MTNLKDSPKMVAVTVRLSNWFTFRSSLTCLIFLADWATFRTTTLRPLVAFASRASGNWNIFAITRREFTSGRRMLEDDMWEKREQNRSRREHRSRRREARRRRKLSSVTSRNLDKGDLLIRFTLARPSP